MATWTTARRLVRTNYTTLLRPVKQPLDGVIQHVQLSLFESVPDRAAPVDAVVPTLVTISTQGDAGVLKPLLDVVGVAGSMLAAYATRELLDHSQIFSLCCGQLVVHDLTAPKQNFCRSSAASFKSVASLNASG